MTTPATAFDRRYSDREAVAVGWDQTLQILRSAELFWISTVRPDGRWQLEERRLPCPGKKCHFPSSGFPAPFGPRKPVTFPGATVNDR